MSRSKKTTARPATPDPRYNSILISKLINRSMKSGKKTVAQTQIYKALDILGEKTGRKPLEVLEDAIATITPQMEVRSRRVGGAAYQVPMPVRANRGSSLAIRWLVNEANKRSNKDYHTFAEKLSAEVLDSLENAGGAMQRKNTAQKMADANKAFAHFRW